MAARRAAGEPLARIVGEKEFWGLTFRLSPETLVPRPDTETVVSAALAAVRSRPAGTSQRILDIGTGSGAILCALLCELPDATGTGTDRARGALETARDNAGRLRLTGRADFVLTDWATAVAGPFDLVVANPPYIESREIAALPLEVRGFDPHLALDGGEDGLDGHRAIVADLGRLLGPRGRAFIEVGAGQADTVARLGAGFGFAASRYRDLAGIERVVELAREGGS
jgi:release factor glutamine methyltransferase